MNNVYLRFLQFVSSDALHQHKQEEISHTAIFLLNEIALKDFEKTPLTVMQAHTDAQNTSLLLKLLKIIFKLNL